MVSSLFYTFMRIVSEDVLWDTITALGMMVCFYYGVTALACVWYFRRSWFKSVKSFLNNLFAPLLGGLLLLMFFVQTSVDSMDPAYGSGSQIGGVGLVFILGIGILLLGVVVMVTQYFRNRSFFQERFETTELPVLD